MMTGQPILPLTTRDPNARGSDNPWEKETGWVESLMGQLGWLTYELEVYRDWFKEPGFSSFVFSTVHDTLVN